MEETEKMLYRYGSLTRQIDECRKNIRELTAEKYACMDSLLRAPKLEGESQKMKTCGDPVYRIVQKMVDIYDARIAKAADVLGGLYTEFDELQRWISAAELNGDEHEYIRLRYIGQNSVTDIAEMIGYSERQTQRLKKRLLHRIEDARRG